MQINKRHICIQPDNYTLKYSWLRLELLNKLSVAGCIDV